MLSTNVKQTHYILSLMFFTLFLFLLSVLLYNSTFSLTNDSLLITHSLIDSPYSFNLTFSLTFSSLIFGAIVSLITSVVLIFAIAYIGTSYNYVEFLTLLFLFVMSMLIVIFLNDLFTVMLG